MYHPSHGGAPVTPRLKTARPRAQLTAGQRDWFRLTNLADTGAVDLFIYDEIGYWGVTASDLVAQLSDLDTDEISVRLNSPGGEIFDGIAIYNCLRSHKAKVTVQVDSLAASIASVIAMAGDEIVMAPHSQMMIHDGLGMCIGNAADMREMAEMLDRQSDNIAEVYQARAGGRKDTWRNRMRAETWYSAQEAVAAGLATRIATPTKKAPAKGENSEEPEPDEAPDMAAQWDLSVFRFPGRENSPGPYAAELLNKASKKSPDDEDDEKPDEPEDEPAEGEEPKPENKTGDEPDEPAEGDQDEDEDEEEDGEAKKSKPTPKSKPKDAIDDWEAMVAQLDNTPDPDDEFARLVEGLQ